MSRSIERDWSTITASTVQEPFTGALRAVEREHNILSAEHEAFTQYRKRLMATETTSTASPERRPAFLDDTQASQTHSAKDVVYDAYRNTVMQTDHYDIEYGESFQANLRAEFGTELATAVMSAHPYTAFLKRRLVTAANDAIDNRERLLEALDKEEAALEEGHSVLRDVEQDVIAIASRPIAMCASDERRQLRTDLTALRDRCDSLAERRQIGDLNPERFVVTRMDVSSIAVYLYQDLKWSHPVLAAIGILSSRLADLDQRLAPQTSEE
jgi:hypothetical protein